MELLQELAHSFEVNAEPEIVWLILWDLETLVRCLPGCERVTILEKKKSYRAEVRRKISAFSIKFELQITIVGSEANRSIDLNVVGRDDRLRSELRQNLRVRLSPLYNGVSKIEITTAIRLRGLLASLGKNLVSMQFSQTLDDFSANIRNAIEARALQAIPGQAPAAK